MIHTLQFKDFLGDFKIPVVSAINEFSMNFLFCPQKRQQITATAELNVHCSHNISPELFFLFL